MSRVLLVTIILIGRTGTEVVCCETARGLRKRNHDVTVYTQQDGPAADRLRAEGFQVTTDLGSVPFVPDVIQANQTFPLLEAIGRFPGTPAISICHDATIWYSAPVDLPSVRHVAVDLACRDRIASRFAHLAERIEILHNAADLDAFQPRAPLPRRPKRALVLAKHSSHVDAVRAACAQRELQLDILGPAVGSEVDDLPARLREYDLVFASARAALEAMAVGCAVIVVDGRGLAGLVTHEAVSWWRQNNFGLRLLSRPASAELILAEIDRYDAADAERASLHIRENSSLERYLDRLEAIHRDVIARSAACPVDKDELIYRLGQAFRAQWESKYEEFVEVFGARAREREAGLRTELEREARTREAALLEQARSREAAVLEQARSREAAVLEQARSTEAALLEQARSTEAALREQARSTEAAHREQARNTEAAHREQVRVLEAEIHRHARAWEAELERRAQAWEAESQRQAGIREAEFQRQLATRQAEFQRQASIKDAEFAALRAWTAPRNLPRRILHKIRRELFGG